MPTSLGTIPEDFPANDVYSVELGDELPTSVTGRRANFEELIWDADGGFAPEWAGRSAISGTGGEGDPYVMLLQRSSFSAAGLALFSYDAAGGGGGSGDATSIVGIPVIGLPDDDQILKYDEATDELHWEDDTGGGGGGSFSVTPTPVVDGHLIELEGTDGLTGKDSGISAASVAAAIASVSALTTIAAYHGYNQGGSVPSGPTTFTDIIGTMTGGTYVDALASGISRSGSSFTVARAGTYFVQVTFNTYAYQRTAHLRVQKNGVTVLNGSAYEEPSTTSYQRRPLDTHGVVVCAANDVLTVQWASQSGQQNTFGSATVDGQENRNLNISIYQVGASVQPAAPAAAGGWQRVVDHNYTQMTAVALANGIQTIGGIPMTVTNANNMDYSRIDSTGMTSKASATSIANFYQDASTGLVVKIKLKDIAPDFIVGQSQLRIWWQGGCNGNANHEVMGMGLQKAPYTGGVSNQAMWAIATGAYDSLNPHQGIIVGRGTSASPSRRDVNLTSVTAANSLLSVWGLSMKSLLEWNFYTYTTAAADAAANDTAASWKQLLHRAQMNEWTGPFNTSAQAAVPATNNTPAGIIETEPVFNIKQVDDMEIIVMYMSTYNTAAHLIGTIKRLVIEVKY